MRLVSVSNDCFQNRYRNYFFQYDYSKDGARNDEHEHSLKMTKPATISILGKTWCQVESFEQFRHQEPTDRTRRIGLKYYVLYEEIPGGAGTAGGSILIEHTITKQTDATWLEKAVNLGHVYLQQIDHDMTLTAYKARETEKQKQK